MQENSLDAPAQWLKYVILKLNVSCQLKSNFNILRDLSQKWYMFGNDSKPQHKHTKFSMLPFFILFFASSFLFFSIFFLCSQLDLVALHYQGIWELVN